MLTDQASEVKLVYTDEKKLLAGTWREDTSCDRTVWTSAKEDGDRRHNALSEVRMSNPFS